MSQTHDKHAIDLSEDNMNDVFAAFNQLSSQLSASFEQLESCVTDLNRGIEAAPAAQLDKLSDNLNLAVRLQAIIDSIPGAVLVLDKKGVIRETNVAATDLLSSPLLGVAWRRVVERCFKQMLDKGELITHSGHHLSISTRPLGYEPGQIVLLTDVSETRVLQKTAEHKTRLSAMGEMVASLAHQVRTPLASAILYLSQNTQKGATPLKPEQLQKFSDKALSRLMHLEQMVNDMLAYAHGGKFTTEKVCVDQLFSDLKQLLEPHLLTRQACINLVLNFDGMQIQGNHDALLGALANLAMNALEASEKGLMLNISAHHSDAGLCEISVSDNGPGIPEDIGNKIFEPFFTTRSDGTGLGLAVVKSVVESHGGEIKVSSSSMGGALFSLTFPAIENSLALLSSAAG
ncbi:MAG: PAS domain-containing sensor histidine kinase [Gammaproteobacteria bacterium]|nr:PAS domain-containing sensor histidine kinase [Gammaproteobacteria bacterium]